MKAYILISLICLLPAFRDGYNYRINGKDSDPKGIWHGAGLTLYVVSCYALCTSAILILYAVLLRAGIYNITYNISAKLPPGHIGTTAKADKIAKWIFKNAIIQAIVSLAALVACLIFIK